MNFNWDGDAIIQDSAVKNKRYVLGSEEQPIDTDIREFVSPADDAVIKEILKELVKTEGLPAEKNPGSFDRRAMIIWNHMARNIEYRNDIKKQRKEDFWLFPSEVKTLRYGDCEDGSLLLASLLIGSDISPFNAWVVLGELYDQKEKSLGGHCWPMYKNEAGRWCILESTFDRAPWSLPTADRFTGKAAIRYVPHFCFNNFHLWSIRHEKNLKDDFKNYLERREKLVDLKNPKFPSGGWLSAITGDNSLGHLELTGEALNQFGFSEDAVSVASDAAQDPDLYEWGNPAAHAQTGCDPRTGATLKSNTDPVKDYLSWISICTNRFLAADRDEHTLFFLGYLLHGIQNLASHQGITNSQHAYDTYVKHKNGNDCDHLRANRHVALDFTTRLLKRLSTKNQNFFKRMKTYDAGFTLFGAKVAKKDKCVLLGRKGWDFSVGAYLEYKELADKYSKVKDDNPARPWNRNVVFKKVLSSIQLSS